MNISTQGQTEDHHHSRNPPTRLFHRPPFILAIILLGYLTAATLFALLTPPWQLPDEPAHYNYIAHIARGDGLPVLKMGDFDAEYIGQVVSERFPAELSVEPLRYESYQPPLYYLTAVPIYWLANGMNDVTSPADYGHALQALRLYGVLLGFGTLLLIYNCLAIAFPDRPAVRLCATAFAGTLPMHVAMTAAVNNDSLAIFLLLASSLVLLRWMKTALSDREVEKKGPFLLLGMLLGFGLMTKIYAYIFLSVCLIIIGLISWRKRDFRQALINAGWVLLPALLLGISVWIRNMTLYGLLDPLGMAWHDAVVVGQATTQGWIEQNGWNAYWQRAIGFTFRSFWGVFGWLGLFWDERLYTLVRILSITVGIGFAGAVLSTMFGIVKPQSNDDPTEDQTHSFHLWVALLLGITAAATLAGYVIYNLKFVQHQGRYFFWGILPISTFFALGWRQLMRARTGRWASIGAMLILTGLAFYTLLLGDRNPWTLLSYLIAVGVLLLHVLLLFADRLRDNEQNNVTPKWMTWVPAAVHDLLSTRAFTQGSAVIQPLLWAAPFLFMFGLCILSIFGYIVPQL